MAKSINPVDFALGMPRQQLQWAQSVHVALNGGVTMGVPTSKNNAGVYNEFDTDTSSGVLIRVGATGDAQQKYVWPAANTPVVINHGLLRQPIGFHVVDIDGATQVYRTSVPDQNTISLAITDNTKNATVYIF